MGTSVQILYIHFSIADNNKLLVVLCIFSIECALLPYFILSFAILLDADLELLGKGDCHVICSYLGDTFLWLCIMIVFDA